MRKRSHHHEDTNRERWLVSYADFITLLFAVFVVMYAVANINLEYYKALLQKSNIALEDDRNIEKSNNNKNKVAMKQQLADLNKKIEMRQEQFKKYVAGKKELEKINGSLQASLQQEVKKDAVHIQKHEDWLSIELKSLFPTASAFPSDMAFPILEKVASSLKRTKNKIAVQGYTDDVPIENEVFPSNWELSAARAAAVVRVLVDFGVNPQQLSATGYGALFPIASNDTEEGRFRNRRIVVLIALNATIMSQLQDGLDKQWTKAGKVTMPDNVETKNIKLKVGDQTLPAGIPQIPSQ